jgi:hypothetical protein
MKKFSWLSLSKIQNEMMVKRHDVRPVISQAVAYFILQN